MTTAAHILVILLCCVAAHVAPVPTLVLSYVVLGPGHYLTELSWLHDRGYFVARPSVMLAACCMTVSGLLIWRSDAAQYGLTLAIVLGTAGAVLGRSAILSMAGVVSSCHGQSASCVGPMTL